MITGFRKRTELSVSRLCESLSLISLIVADSWFAVIFLSNMIEAIWYSNLLIVDHYIVISAGILWSIVYLKPGGSKYSSKLTNLIKLRNNKVARASLLGFGSMVFVIFLVVSYYEKPNSDLYSVSSNYGKDEIRIGILLGLSGSSFESGITQKAVLQNAVHDINENFSKANIQKKVVLLIEDTEIKPEVAVDKVKKLVDEGVQNYYWTTN